MKIKNRSGMSMFVVLTFMFVSLLLGSAFVYMSKNNIENQGAYYQIKTAQEASESALNWFQTLIQKGNSDSIFNFLKNASDQKYYYSGNSNNFDFSWTKSSSNQKPIKLTPDGKFYANLVIDNIDTTNFIVKLHAIGKGKDNSQKTIHAVYKLAGTVSNDVSTPYSDQIAKHALYTNSGWQNMNGKVKIIGDAYSGGKVVFNDGSIIDGDLKVMGSNLSTFNGTVTLTGNFYTKGDVTFNGTANITGTSNAKYFWVDGKMIVDNGVTFSIPTYLNGGFSTLNSKMTFNSNTFINSNDKEMGKDINFNGDSLIINGKIIPNGNKINLNGDYSKLIYENSLKSGDVVLNGTHSSYKDNVGETTIDRDAILGVTGDQTEKEISVDIPAIKSKTDIKLSDYFDTDFFNNTSDKLDAKYINELYENGTTTLPNGKTITWDKSSDADGILTLDFDIAKSDLFSGTIDGGVRLAVVMNADVNSNGKFWGSTIVKDSEGNPIDEKSSSILLVEGDGSINNLGVGTKDNPFRGLIYTKTGLGTMDHAYVYGSIIDKSTAAFNPNNALEVTMDNNAIADFLPMGVIRDPDGTIIQPTETKITQTLVSNISAQLLSKY